MEMKQDGRLPAFGKRERHDSHFWWYTPYGGGHQLNEISHPDTDYDDGERKILKRWLCLGREHYGA
jgi:hypothetical protein